MKNDILLGPKDVCEGKVVPNMQFAQEICRVAGEIVDLVANAERSDYASKIHKGRSSDEFMKEREQLFVAIYVCRECLLRLEKTAALPPR